MGYFTVQMDLMVQLGISAHSPVILVINYLELKMELVTLGVEDYHFAMQLIVLQKFSFQMIHMCH